MSFFTSMNESNFENTSKLYNEKIKLKTNDKDIEEEYDDNFDDGINDNDVNIRNENLNVEVNTDDNKNFQNLNFTMNKKKYIKRSSNINNSISDTKITDPNKNNINVGLQSNSIEHSKKLIDTTNDSTIQPINKTHSKIGLIFISIIIVIIICFVIFTIYYIFCRRKKKLKKKVVKRKNKVAKNAREKGAEDRYKAKKTEKKNELKKNKESNNKKNLPLQIKTQNKEVPLYTAIINENNNEKLYETNYLSQKQNINQQDKIIKTSIEALNENSYSETVDKSICTLLYTESSMIKNKCNCNMGNKSKKTLYTQRGNATEWKVIQEENIYDDFSFQISSSNNE
uniref:INCENP_ARK-bind domain-containing protein n=1 Tax=Strongyloides stercoralis TaxID=6248 RepID=A0A0K0ELZ2_STRER